MSSFARALWLLPGVADPLIDLELLRYVNGNLQQCVQTYLSSEQYPDILHHDFSGGSLYDFIEARHGVKLAPKEVVVRIERVDARMADYSQVEEDAPILAMDSTVYDSFDTVVAFGVALQPPAYSEIEFVSNGLRD